MSYPVYKEFQSPTAVEFSVWVTFLGAPHLVVARQTVLDVYSVGSYSPNEAGTEDYAQMKLVSTYQMSANIASMEVLHLSKKVSNTLSGTDFLDVIMVTAKDAKVSVVGLDPFTMMLKTIAMWNFEEGALGPGCIVQGTKSYVHPSGMAATAVGRVDPDMRCAAMVPYDNQIAVMPLNGNADMFDEDDTSGFLGSSTFSALESDTISDAVDQDHLNSIIFRKPFIINTKSIDRGLGGKIADMTFLSGYDVTPTLCMLVELGLTSASRLASLQYTYTLVTLSIDMRKQITPILWQKNKLPHDCYSLVAPPQPVGGVLILSPNAIMYFSEHRYVGLALNGFAAQSVDYKTYSLQLNNDLAPEMPELAINLESARAVILSPSRVLLCGLDGSVSLLRLHLEGTDVQYMTLMPQQIMLGPSVHLNFRPCSLISAESAQALQAFMRRNGAPNWSIGLLFQSSRSADSLLSVLALKTGSVSLNRLTQGVASSLPAGGLGSAVPGGLVGSLGGASSGTFGSSMDSSGALGPDLAFDDDDIYSASTSAPSVLSSRFGAPSSTPAPVPSLDDLDDDIYGTSTVATESVVVVDSSASFTQSMTQAPSNAFTASQQPQGGATPSLAEAELCIIPVDTLPSFGPVISSTLGRAHRSVSLLEDEPPTAPPLPELVSAVGGAGGRSGAVAVGMTGLRANPITRLKLAGTQAVFTAQLSRPIAVQSSAAPSEASDPTVNGDSDELMKEDTEEDFISSLMFLRTAEATRLFTLSQDLIELEDRASGAATNEPTVLAATARSNRDISWTQAVPALEDVTEFHRVSFSKAFGDKSLPLELDIAAKEETSPSALDELIVQITTQRLVFLEPRTHFPVAAHVPIHEPSSVGGLGIPPHLEVSDASISDGLVTLLLTDGTVHLVAFGSTSPSSPTAENSENFEIAHAHISHSGEPFTAVCVYSEAVSKPLSTAIAHGIGSEPATMAAFRHALTSSKDSADFLSETSSFLFLCRRSGVLEIRPLWTLMASTVLVGLHLLPSLLGPHREGHSSVVGHGAIGFQTLHTYPHAHLGTKGVGSKRGRPSLVATMGPTADHERAGDLKAVSFPTRFIVEIAAQQIEGNLMLTVLDSSDEAATYVLVKPVFDPSVPLDSSINSLLLKDQYSVLHHNSASIFRFAKCLCVGGTTFAAPSERKKSAQQVFHTTYHSTNTSSGIPSIEHVNPPLRSKVIFPFDCIGGWAGALLLTMTPQIILSVRSCPLSLPLVLPDLRGIAGTLTRPGEFFFEPGYILAGAPVHTAFCPNGLVLAAEGSLHFCQLPRPQWPVPRRTQSLNSNVTNGASIDTRAVPQVVPPDLVLYGGSTLNNRALTNRGGTFNVFAYAFGDAYASYHAGSTEAERAEMGSKLGTHLQLSWSGVPLANGVLVRFVWGLQDESTRRFVQTLAGTSDSNKGEMDPKEDLDFPLLISDKLKRGITSSAVSEQPPLEEEPEEAQEACTLIVPGPAFIPTQVHRILPQHMIHHVSYMEHTSAQDGLRGLQEWVRAKEGAAASAGVKTSLDHVRACISPVYAVVFSQKTPRNPLADEKEIQDLLDSLGGEYVQDNTGAANVSANINLAGNANGGGAQEHQNFGSLGSQFGSAPATYNEQQFLTLVHGSGSPYGTWQVANQAFTFAFEKYERVTVVKEVKLQDYHTEGASSEHLLLVGTGFVTQRGEDLHARGRLLLFRIAQVEVDAGQASAGALHTRKSVLKIPPVYEEEVGEIVTDASVLCCPEKYVTAAAAASATASVGPSVNVALSHISNILRTKLGNRIVTHLVVALASRLQVHEWRNEKLREIAFHDFNTYISSICVVKNYVFCTDRLHGSRMLCWRDEDHQLFLMASDASLPRGNATGALVRADKLALVAADLDGSLKTLRFDPSVDDWHLIRSSDIFLGSSVGALVSSVLPTERGVPVRARTSFGLICGMKGGSFGALIPLPEPVFQRLLALQRVLSLCIPHPGGFNPQLWRLQTSRFDTNRRAVNGTLDGLLLWRFMHLSAVTQYKFAEAIGSSVETIKSNLRLIDVECMMF